MTSSGGPVVLPPVPFNDLSRGVARDLDALQAVAAGIVAGGWYVHGPEHAAFEAEFAKEIGTTHCIGVASGTDALELAVRSVAKGRSGPVVVAANAGGYATVAARRAGREVRFADTDQLTLCLSAKTVEPVLDGAAAVVTTHLYGRVPDLRPLVQLCRQHGVPLVEDCAQAAGAGDHGGLAGSLADVGTFSFYPTKNLAALGDGGAVTTSDDELADRVRRLRQYGWGAKYTVLEDGGVNSRLDEIQAAMLRRRLPLVHEENARRREVIGAYAEAAEGGPVRVLPAVGPWHSGHLAVCLTPRRTAVREAMSAAGISTEVHYPVPDHRQPAWASAYRDVQLPVTEQTSEMVLSLPCFPDLTDEEIGRVCGVLSRVDRP